ncbi:MAG: nicotinate-nucleotide adenylyltransferase [Eubacterium sp.]|nr:nicotinate-nucleotide adenylyltransferase [Eubacterium sp.]
MNYHMKKIGILGGTFNPVHTVHLQMAEAACDQYDLDEVWFMPSNHPPHKEESDIVSNEHRQRMIQFAIDGCKKFCFSDFEYHRPGTTYTSDTLSLLQESYPDTQFYFIMGEDSLRDFDSWHEPEKIAEKCLLLVCSREGHSLMELCRKMNEKYGSVFSTFHIPTSCISSSYIREQLQDGILPYGQLPPQVLSYIRLHGLYQTTSWRIDASKDTNMKQLIPMLQSSLRPKRFLHTLGVADTASNLAVIHGISPENARLAGMLHDCAKYLTDAEMIEACEKNNIQLTGFERSNPALIHSKLGVFVARDRYGIKNSSILSAIACHTTGKPDMTSLEKILFIADYIEPGRKMDCKPNSLKKIRQTSFQDLDKSLTLILENTIHYLTNENLPIDPVSKETYLYYKKESPT